MSYFTYLNLPSIPSDLVDKILYLSENPLNNFHATDELVEHMKSNRDNLNISASNEVIDAITNLKIDYDKSLGYPLSEAATHFKELAQFDFLEVSEEIDAWARENISPDIAYVSIQSMYGGTTITPHVDEMRRYAYNYVITEGGDSRTVFYKPKEEYKHLEVYPQTIFPYDRITVMEKITIKKNIWHYLDTSTIHSVENLDPTKKRISLSLSFL